ncbi:MAG TPA: DUF4230 domain-containing protein [Streptosporangiaceae bacterium]
MDPEDTGSVRTDRTQHTEPLGRFGGERQAAGTGAGSSGRPWRPWRIGRLAGLIAVIAAVVIALVLALSTVHLLPQLRNPFAETTTDRSSPALLKSISAMSRYEAASGSFQVIVNLDQRTSWLPTFVEGTQTLFVGQGTDIAYVDFSALKGSSIKVSKNRKAVTVQVPAARLQPATLNVKRSYVFAQQQGLLNRIGNFFSGNPNSQHQVYVLAQQKIQVAARHSGLLAQAQRNTQNMLTQMLHSLGFRRVMIVFAKS